MLLHCLGDVLCTLQPFFMRKESILEKEIKEKGVQFEFPSFQWEKLKLIINLVTIKEGYQIIFWAHKLGKSYNRPNFGYLYIFP